ncbi:serine/threonine-protein kinase dst2-like [Saccostrea echinata]|uniref:serine/threonine-protein kinase dst2-like n=1 Tax=Saccostrea echinata TaxID=191078 RepID=UPI002A81270D|nr:serine/threonine-protein kinase dst2-like [Saccostrea echinata]
MDKSSICYKGKLQSVWGKLKKDVRLSDIADPLVESGTLSLEQWEELKSAHLPERDRTERFLFILIKQNSPNNFRAFVEALKNNGHGELATKLQSKDNAVPGLQLSGQPIQYQTKYQREDSRDSGASGFDESESAMKESVLKMETLMEKLEMMYERQEQKIDSVISEQQTARKQMGVLLENNESIKTQMGNIAADIESKFDTFQIYHEEKNQDYELLKERHEELLEDHRKKEEELKSLQIQLQKLEADPEAHSNDKFKNLQTQFIALKKTNEERVNRLKNLHTETKTFLKKYAEAFQVPHPEHLSEIIEHFESIQESMQKLKTDNESLMEKLKMLVEQNENLITQNQKLEEEMSHVEKQKSKIEERIKTPKGEKGDKTTGILKVKGKKCH